MPITTTIVAGRESQAIVTSRAPMTRSLAIQGAKLLSWKAVLVQSLGREFHALHIQQQERAFMATTHGLNYSATNREVMVVH